MVNNSQVVVAIAAVLPNLIWFPIIELLAKILILKLLNRKGGFF